MTHNLNAVVRVLEQQERNLHIILDKAPLSPQLRKQLRDHAAQTSLLRKRIENYGMRLSGVVRAKN